MILLFLISLLSGLSYANAVEIDGCYCRDRITGEDCSHLCKPSKIIEKNTIDVIPTGLETINFPKNSYNFVYCEVDSRTELVTHCVISKLAMADYCRIELKYNRGGNYFYYLDTDRVTSGYILLKKNPIQKLCSEIRKEQVKIAENIERRRKELKESLKMKQDDLFDILDKIICSEHNICKESEY